MATSLRVALVGATGAVGAEFLSLFERINFPISELRLFASARSEGKHIVFRGERLPVNPVSPGVFKGIDVAFFSAGASRSLEFGPMAVNEGAIVIDNSSAFRLQDDVPLVVPEVNPEALSSHKGLIANPNCSTIQLVVALKPIHDAVGIKRVFVATYQAVSGTGAKAITELETQLAAHVRGEPLVPDVYPAPIALNVIPQVDVFLEDGYTKEEMKMVLETQKIMGLPDLKVSATCVRVPVIRAHSEAVQIETYKPVSVEEAREIWRRAPGVKVLDEHRPAGYPMPRDIAGSFDTYVGRIRKDIALDNGLSCWVVADQLLKGAALNAVQIAQKLFNV